MDGISTQFWIGTSVTVVSGFLAWAGRTVWIRYSRMAEKLQKLEQEKITDTEERFMRIANDQSKRIDVIYKKIEATSEELSRKLSENLLKMTTFELKLSQFSDVITVVQRMKDDLSFLKGQITMRKTAHKFEDEGGHDS